MHFKPRDSVFYSFVAQLSSFRRYLIASGVIVSVILLWLFFIYMPLGAQIVQYSTECACLRTQCSEYMSARVQCTTLRQEIDTLHTELDICIGNCNNVSPSSCIATLMNHVHDAGVDITSCSIQEQVKKKWYDEEIIAVQGHGTLKQLGIFFDRLSQKQDTLSYIHYSLTRAENDTYTFSCSLCLRSIMKKPFNLEQAEGLGG